MKLRRGRAIGFTLLELLVVIAVIAVLAALLLPALGRAKNSSRRAECLGKLRQVSMAIDMYVGDHLDLLPAAQNVSSGALETNHFAVFYKRMVKGYLGMRGASSSHDRVFACPADSFYYDWPSLNEHARNLHDQPISDYSSYGFNGSNDPADKPPPAFLNETSYGGISGRKQTSIQQPSRTVLVAEFSSFSPWSWHEPQKLPAGKFGVNNARNIMAFMDGHAAYIRIYWNEKFNLTAACYEPPANYGYKWHAD